MPEWVPLMVGATDRDLAIGVAESKGQLFANFGSDSAEARRLYDPRGDQTLDELKQQVFAERTRWNRRVTLPMKRRAPGSPSGSTVSLMSANRNAGTLYGCEIPFTLNVPAALVGDKVTPTDERMGDLASS